MRAKLTVPLSHASNDLFPCFPSPKVMSRPGPESDLFQPIDVHMHFGTTNLNLLWVFHAVASQGSFTRAASSLHLTQPGVSKHVRQLEKHYGMELFERRGRTVALTRAGYILYEATREIVACLGRTGDRLKELHGATPTLPLASTFTVGLYVVPSLLASFRSLHPEVKTTLEIFPAATVEARVLDQSFDVGLVGHEVRDKRLVATEFFSDDLVVVVPAGHRWTSRIRGIRPEELREEPFIATAVGSGTRMVVEDRLSRNGIRLTEVLDFGNMEGVKKAVEAGLGVSVLSKSVIEREVSAGLLSMARLVGRDMKRRFLFIRRKGCTLSGTAQGFLKHLLEAHRQ